MALAVELPINGLSYRGFAQMVYDDLKELGVPIEQVKYVYRGKPGPDRLQGHSVTPSGFLRVRPY